MSNNLSRIEKRKFESLLSINEGYVLLVDAAAIGRRKMLLPGEASKVTSF